MFVNLNKIGNLQFGGAIIELLFGETTIKEYNRLDLGIWDGSTGFPIESFPQMIDYNVEASFYRTVDLKEQLFV